MASKSSSQWSDIVKSVCGHADQLAAKESRAALVTLSMHTMDGMPVTTDASCNTGIHNLVHLIATWADAWLVPVTSIRHDMPIPFGQARLLVVLDDTTFGTTTFIPTVFREGTRVVWFTDELEATDTPGTSHPDADIAARLGILCRQGVRLHTRPADMIHACFLSMLHTELGIRHIVVGNGNDNDNDTRGKPIGRPPDYVVMATVTKFAGRLYAPTRAFPIYPFRVSRVAVAVAHEKDVTAGVSVAYGPCIVHDDNDDNDVTTEAPSSPFLRTLKRPRDTEEDTQLHKKPRRLTWSEDEEEDVPLTEWWRIGRLDFPWRPIIGDCTARFPHPRDAHIQFDEKEHKYYIDGDMENPYPSITETVHEHFAPFVADDVIDGIMSRDTYKAGKGRWGGMTRAEIKRAWDGSADYGTEVHAAIEAYLLQRPARDVAEAKHLAKHLVTGALRFIEDHPMLQPYRMEWRIFHRKSRRAGTIDAMFVDVAAWERLDPTVRDEITRGERPMPLVMIDWKNCENLGTRAYYEKDKPRAMGTTPVTGHLEDCKYSKYSLQLNLYRWIFERSYNIEVTEMALVNFRPSCPDTYKMYPVKRIDVDDIFDTR